MNRNKDNWYYKRGLNNPKKWARKFFLKYGRWIWSTELFEQTIPHHERVLYALKPFTSPYLYLFKNDNVLRTVGFSRYANVAE